MNDKYTNYCQWLLSHSFHSQILCTIVVCINDILHHIAGVFLSVRFESGLLSTPGSITGGAFPPFITISRPYAYTLILWILQHTWIVFTMQLVFTAYRVDIHVCDVTGCRLRMAEVSNGSQREEKTPPLRWVSAQLFYDSISVRKMSFLLLLWKKNMLIYTKQFFLYQECNIQMSACTAVVHH